MGDNAKLVVIFDEIDILVKWKKLCLGVNGSGGIKKRISDFVKRDLKDLEKEILK